MIEAFLNDEDIHKQAASKVLNIPIDEVTKEQRANAKAVNFGIVYGISDFGLASQLGISKKQAKEYIEQYLEKYSGIKNFMDNIVEEAKEKGYAETLFKRKRQIPELKSTNYMVRQFGARVAMNTPIQGTAADIMKIAMIDVYNKLKEEGLKSKLVLQVHDELLIDTVIEEKDRVCEILKTSMENAIKLKIPLKVELSVANDWCEAK
jgi:DNA polymerase-1